MAGANNGPNHCGSREGVILLFFRHVCLCKPAAWTYDCFSSRIPSSEDWSRPRSVIQHAAAVVIITISEPRGGEDHKAACIRCLPRALMKVKTCEGMHTRGTYQYRHMLHCGGKRGRGGSMIIPPKRSGSSSNREIFRDESKRAESFNPFWWSSSSKPL